MYVSCVENGELCVGLRGCSCSCLFCARACVLMRGVCSVVFVCVMVDCLCVLHWFVVHVFVGPVPESFVFEPVVDVSCMRCMFV